MFENLKVVGARGVAKLKRGVLLKWLTSLLTSTFFVSIASPDLTELTGLLLLQLSSTASTTD